MTGRSTITFCYGKFPKTFGWACHWQWWMLRPTYKARWFDEVVKSSRLLSAGTWGHPRDHQLRERGPIRFNVSSSVTLDSRMIISILLFFFSFAFSIQFKFSAAHSKLQLLSLPIRLILDWTNKKEFQVITKKLNLRLVVENLNIKMRRYKEYISIVLKYLSIFTA